MKKLERKILMALVNYWDGMKGDRWPKGPIPDPGDYVLEEDLAKEVGRKLLDPEFMAAVGSLKNQECLKRETTDYDEFEADGNWKITPTLGGMKLVQDWGEQRPLRRLRIYVLDKIVPILISLALGSLVTWVSVRACTDRAEESAPAKQGQPRRL